MPNFNDVVAAAKARRPPEEVAAIARQVGHEPMIVVTDIDGVLADARWRLHLIGVDTSHDREMQGATAKPKKDWDAFYAAVKDDPPLWRGVALVKHFAQWYDILYLSGRRESCRPDTLAWLARHGLPGGQLLLRPDQDYRPSAVLKPERLRPWPPHKVRLILEDDPRIVKALRDNGYFVHEATWAK